MRLGVDTLLIDFGIFVSINYLISVEKKSKELAIKMVGMAYHRVCESGLKNKVIDKTVKYNICPIGSIIINTDQFKSYIKKQYNLTIEFDVEFKIDQKYKF